MPDPKLLIGDHAIDLPEEDRLERSGFVDVLTRTVERAPTRGFVVGLASAWGEGKTSVLNLLAYRLEQRATAQVVRFNPWLFSKADELVERFFSEFSAQVKLGGGRSTQRLAKALERYGRAAAPLRSIPKLGIVVGGTATAAQGGAALMRAGMTLDQRRRDLEHELRKANRPIVVIVDDLDRLQSDQEIAEMVRLIRLVGELPRVAYVVAYDRPVIAVALGAGDEERGQIYLEKVIQAPFDLPPVRSDLLEDLLSATISEAVGDLSGRRFNRERFTSLQVAGLYMLFANMRDVRRYASALPAIIGVLTDEVELSDVLALEALRLREPASFELIADSADVLTGSRDLLQAVRRRDDADAVRMQDIVARARRPEVVRDLVRELFPAGGRHLGGSTYSESFQSVWRRECRVAHPDVFLTYLQRGLPSGRVPARTVEEARTLLNC